MKRTLSIILSIAVCFSLLPSTAFAAENTSGTELTANTTTIADGDYYLLGDVNLTTTLEIGGTVNLYLNGHMLKGTSGNDVIRTKAGATLNLYDDPDSTITHEVSPVYDADAVVTVKGGLITGGGRGIQIIGGTTVHMYGGTIACNGSVPANYRQHGGGVSVGPNATFVLHDGAIRNNIAGYGGGVNVNGSGGSFIMYDGKICDNRAFPDGGGVYINGGSFELHDGEISSNLITPAVDGEARSGGGIHFQGEKLTISGGKIHGNEAEFGGGMSVGGTSEVLMTGGEISNNEAEDEHGSIGGGVYIGGSSTFRMEGGSILNNRVGQDGGGVGMRSDTKFELVDGEISGNYATSGGGGVSINGSPEFIMLGGRIYNNSTDGHGGGVQVTSSKGLTLKAGKIDHNSATKYGGGAYIDTSGILSLSGGEISDNTAGENGGGVYVSNSGIFRVSDAPIVSSNVLGGVINSGILAGGTDNNVYLAGDALIAVADPLSNVSPIGVITEKIPTKSAPVTITSDYDAKNSNIAPVTFFASDDERYQVLYNEDETEAVLALISPPTHTATFIADGRVVAEVTFDEGDATLTEPAVPTKAHYDGVWESYNLAAATDDITVDAVYTLNNSHSYVATSTVSPTCTEQGYTTYRCSICGDEYNGDYVAALGHDYHLNESKSLAPAVGVEGYDYYECSHDASHFYTTPVAALSMPTHTATFMSDGKTVATIAFTEGDASLAEPAVPAKAHYDGAWEDYDLAAATDDIAINALYTLNNDHSYTAANVVLPTCTERGYTLYKCSVCGDERMDDYVDALGHDYYHNAEKSKAPEVGIEGYDYYECSHDEAHFYKTALPALKATHTATFMIGDTVVAVVTFTEGDATLSEPAIPDRANYVGAWDAYDLTSATADIVVYGRYAPVDPDQVSDLGADASATYANGVATITLSASAPSRTIKVTSEQAKPIDVVLVLDQSGSMADTLGARQSKRDALVSCANDFVTQLYQNAVATGAEHRVAVVGFAYSAYNNGKYANTGLLATTSGNGKNYANLKDADYKAALLPINNGGRINANVVAGINSIVTDGATAADLGLKMAKNIFTENPANGTHERIVIFITDGTPTSWGETPSLITQTAADAIAVANTIKNTQNAKIYSVGVEASANPATAFSSAANGVTTDWRGNFVSYDFTRFLHAVSSNYPSAASMSNMGGGDKSTGYYMAVNDTSSLGKIFTNILYNTVYELKTFDKATLFYTLTDDFTLTMEQELALRDRLKTDYGLTDADITVVRNADGTTSIKFQNVKAAQGYDANGNLCYTATVSFEVSANKDVSGRVATGTSDSGASYEGATAVSFTIPTVNIPAERSIIVFTINGKIYRMLDVAQGDAITVPESQLAKWTIPDGTVVEGNYAAFEAMDISDTYSMHWIIDGNETVQSYAVGDKVTPPTVPDKAGYDFTGWSPSAPATMPLYSLVCTATYALEHDHEWVEVYKTGACDTGITTHYECVCGKEKDEPVASHAHNFVAVLSDNGSAGNTVEKLVCTDCGYSKAQNVTFKVTYTQSRKTTVLDLNLFENDVSVTEPSQAVQMRFYIGDTGKSYTVTRIDSDNKRTSYTARPIDGYLVFDIDHFSVYVLSELDEETNTPVETLTYDESTKLLDEAQPVVDDTPLPDQADSPSTPNNPSTPSMPNNPSNDTTTPHIPWYQPTTPSTTPTQSGNGKQSESEEETPEALWQNPYADISENTYYYAAVAWASKLGVTLGTSETTFSPNKTCSRAEIVTFLWRAKGSPEPTLTESPFDDLDEDAYYYKAALWAYENGITYGASETSFAPSADCTRSQAVTFLWRAENQPEASVSDFVDVDSDAYYAAAVNWAAAQEITNGTGNGAFSPEMVCTRAQIVTFLYRDLAEKIDKLMM